MIGWKHMQLQYLLLKWIYFHEQYFLIVGWTPVVGVDGAFAIEAEVPLLLVNRPDLLEEEEYLPVSVCDGCWADILLGCSIDWRSENILFIIVFFDSPVAVNYECHAVWVWDLSGIAIRIFFSVIYSGFWLRLKNLESETVCCRFISLPKILKREFRLSHDIRWRCSYGTTRNS